MNTENQTPVQPELIWVDEKNLKKEEINVVRGTTALNRFILECEKILKRELSNDFKIVLKDRKMKVLMEEVRKKFPFSDATEEFNLQSLGIDLTAVKSMANDHSNSWSGIQFEIDDMGLFVAIDDQEVYKHYHYYADSDNRKKALEIAKKLVELTEEANKIGMLDNMHLVGIRRAFRDIVMQDVSGERNNRLVVYYEAIANTIR